MQKIKAIFLSLFLWGSLLGNTSTDHLNLSYSDTSFSERYFDFCTGKKGGLIGISHLDLMGKADLQKSLVEQKLYPELSRFKLPSVYSWDLNYTQKQRARQEQAQKEKEYVQLLRQMDSTRKTEYFRKVLCSPLPEACKGDPKYNPSQHALIFSFD